jgi:hypothetical protein
MAKQRLNRRVHLRALEKVRQAERARRHGNRRKRAAVGLSRRNDYRFAGGID